MLHIHKVDGKVGGAGRTSLSRAQAQTDWGASFQFFFFFFFFFFFLIFFWEWARVKKNDGGMVFLPGKKKNKTKNKQ